MHRTSYVLFAVVLCCETLLLYIYNNQQISQPVAREELESVCNCSRNATFTEPTKLKLVLEEEIDFNFTEDFLESLYKNQHEAASTSSSSLFHLTERGLNFFNSYKKPILGLSSDLQSIFEKRLETQSICKNLNLDPVIDLSRMIYDDNHKTVMCVIPKAACTTWKSFMFFLQGNIKTKEEHQHLLKIEPKKLMLEPSGPMKTMQSLPMNEAIKRLLTYTTFYVTRHPFQRLVSAYSSKFTHRNKEKTYKDFLGKLIALEQADKYMKGVSYSKTKAGYKLNENEVFKRLPMKRQKEVIDYIEVMNSGRISFRQLVEFVVYNKLIDYQQDVHWRPQVALCNPCAVHYDYVIKFENFAEDSNKLLKFLQRNDEESRKLFLDTTVSSHIDTNSTSDAFSGLPDGAIKDLIKMYAKDFELLGYSQQFT